MTKIEITPTYSEPFFPCLFDDSASSERVKEKSYAIFLSYLQLFLSLRTQKSDTRKKRNPMYAIVDIAGQQFKVEKNQKLYVHRLGAGEGENISFDKVLLIENDSKISVGDPLIQGASVSAKVLSHVKGDKVLVFKKKRRKGYQKLNGHRQYMTQIQIEDILLGGKGGKKAESQKAVEEAKSKIGDCKYRQKLQN
jgi:large subunit ribosomal protein L21